jgi:hypothetical protein
VAAEAVSGRNFGGKGRAHLNVTAAELAWLIDRALPAWQQQPDLVRYLKNKHAIAEGKPHGTKHAAEHQADAPH